MKKWGVKQLRSQRSRAMTSEGGDFQRTGTTATVDIPKVKASQQSQRYIFVSFAHTTGEWLTNKSPTLPQGPDRIPEQSHRDPASVF